MKNKKWNKFDKLQGKCYNNMIGAEEDGTCWKQAFELMMEIVREERKDNPNYALELEELDDVTDYEYDILGWLADCLDEIGIEEEYESLLQMCECLLNEFNWPEYTGSDIKFQKAVALGVLQREQEAAQFCEQWISTEPENVIAAAAGVTAYIGIRNFEAAEELVDRFIPDKSKCIDENDVMFMAASALYQVMGRKKEKIQVEKAMKAYEKEVQKQLEMEALGDELDFLDDEEFPFLGNGGFLTDDDWLEDEFDEDEDLPFD